MSDTFLAVRQRIHERSAHSYSPCAQTERLDDVSPATNAAVDVNLAFAARDDLGVELVDLEESVEGGR
jgi:hypothetical protein